MYIVVGLGNPDLKYAHTRHNAGFLAVDALADKLGVSVAKRAHKSLVGEGYVGGKKVVLAKPQTYMNNSGEAVVELLNWYKIDPAEELIVIYDDVDLDVGELRLRARGSAGTHNGMRSIIRLTGTDDFPRVRVGIGKPLPGWDLAAYVLGVFPEEGRDVIRDSLKKAADAAACIISEGMNAAGQKYNIRKKKPKPEKPKKAEPADADGASKENASEKNVTEENASERRAAEETNAALSEEKKD